jgi:hypothetical protein
MEILTIREHTTAALLMTLQKNDEPIDLEGVHHVRLDMMDSHGKTFTFSSNDISPAVVIVTPSDGLISFTAPNENFFRYQNTPYQVYCWVYEDATKKYSVPETGFAQINLEKEY